MANNKTAGNKTTGKVDSFKIEMNGEDNNLVIGYKGDAAGLLVSAMTTIAALDELAIDHGNVIRDWFRKQLLHELEQPGVWRKLHNTVGTSQEGIISPGSKYIS